jgi:N-acetylmuramoyl-L-alanine amidase
MKRLLIILDAGHGGIIDGKYVTAPSKMHDFGGGVIAYEGEINRSVKNKLIGLLLKEGIAFCDVSKGEKDISLPDRVAQANAIADMHAETHNSLYISIHSNAGGGSGFEVWTSPGQTQSDKYAEIWAQELKKAFPEFPLRADRSDGDLDKEEKFFVLVHTSMPAILGELLFFDNYNDYKLQLTSAYYERVALATISFIKRSINEVL